MTIRATGYPAPALAETRALPDGLTFTDHRNGTATIAGTPATGSSGHYSVTVIAANTKGKAARHFMIIVFQHHRMTTARVTCWGRHLRHSKLLWINGRSERWWRRGA